MSPRQSVICPGCGAQCAAAVAAAHGWTEHACPKCPPIPSPNDPHPLVVAFAWWPDYPEAQPDARPVYTATCGCGWSAAGGSERHAWHAAWDYSGVLNTWATRPLPDRPRPDAGPRDRRRMRWEIEAARLPGVPLRTDIGEAANTAEAVELLDREDPDVVVVEIQMPVSQGLETIAAPRSRSPGLRIVVCSFHCDPATKERALAQGADAYLDKPVSSVYLKALFRRLFPEPSSGAEAPPEEHPQPASVPLVLRPARRRPGGCGSMVPTLDPPGGPSAGPSEPSE